MLFKNIKRYSAYFVCITLVLCSVLPAVFWTAAASPDNPLITSFEEGQTAKELKDAQIIQYSGDITVSDDEAYVCDGRNSLLFRPKNDVDTDWDSALTVNLNESVKNAYGITFKVYNADLENSAALRCLLVTGDKNNPIKYQCLTTVSPSKGWQTVTVDFENIGLFGGEECYGGTSAGNRMPYDEICKLTAIRFRMPYIGKNHKGVYFDDFQYIFKEESDDIITAERTLVSFDGCETGKVSNTLNPLPENVSVLSTYKGTQSIAEDQEGKKLYTVALDKSVSLTTTGTKISDRPYIALSVNIPEKYAQYLDSVNVDIKNNTKKPTLGKIENTYFVVGITDNQGAFGKTVSESEQLAYNADGAVTKNMSDMLRINGESVFLGKTSATEKWNKRQYSEIKRILIYIALPKYSRKSSDNYSVSIGDISITLKGDRNSIEKIDEIKKELLDFDSIETLDELSTSGIANIFVKNGKFTLCKDDAHTGSNSLLYKSEADGVNYESSISISLEKRAAGCAGVEFYVKNLDSSQNVNIRTFLIVGKSGAEKKYQFIKDVLPSENGEYTRIRILFNNVGLVTADEMWGGTNEGNALTASEIENLVTLRVRTPYLTSSQGGVLFDSFRLITDEDIPKPEDLVRRMLDFDDCEVGGELPENITVTDRYGGSFGVAEDSNGDKVFRVNYDLQTDPSIGTKIIDRPYVQLQLNVPKTSLKGATEIRVGMTNNAVSFKDPWEQTTNIFQVVGIRGGGYYGKFPENADRVYDKGELSEIKIPLDKMIRSEAGLTGWCAPTSYWTKSQLGDVTSIIVYITAPTCDGNEDWSFDINYIDVYYEDVAQNYETETRCAVNANRVSSEKNSYIKAEKVKLSKKDPNYSMFTTAWKLSLNKSATPTPLKFLNTYTNYYSDLKDFTTSATLGFYLQSSAPLDIELTLRDKAGEELSFTAATQPPENSGQYGVYQFVFQDILSEYYRENPEGTFNVSDIRSLEVLPKSEGELPSQIMLSGLSIWTMEVGNAVVYSGYHYSDNGVTVDAYNDYLPLDTVTVVETEEAKSAVKNYGIKLPKGLTPLLFKNITLYTANGSVTEPTGRIWISFELGSGIDFSEISLYKVFFDGSFIKQRFSVEDESIAVNTFTTGSFLITKGKIIEEAPDKTDESENNEEIKPTPEAPNGDKEEQKAPDNNDITESNDNPIINTDNNDLGFTDNTLTDNSFTENTDNESESTIIRKKVITKVVRNKKKKDSGLMVWAVVLIVLGAVVIVGTGTAATVIFVKKRRKAGGAK